MKRESAIEGMAPPCRLFVYLAREAPVGVVLRRGPTDWARLSIWHRMDGANRAFQPAPLGEASWADRDERGCLVVARAGRLLTWDVDRGFEPIADFNGRTPDPQPAPGWATEWPPPTTAT